MPWSYRSISQGFVSLLLTSIRPLRSYKHLLILPCSIKALLLMCARGFNLHCVFTPAPLSKILLLLFFFWMAPSPPGLHSLIDCRRLWLSSGSGLVFRIYNAPALQKEASIKHCQPSLHPPKMSAWSSISISQEIKLTHQRKDHGAHVWFLYRDFFLYYYDYVLTLRPLPSLLLQPAHLGVSQLFWPSLLTVCIFRVANQTHETLCGPHFLPIRQSPSLMAQ